ncbi:MAG: hypothetical protein HKO55_04175 [Gammaproteobacteria bacterium]|nr:hypothetical protein [Gammaproteobacteria bacterium]NNM20452.1 hypothetical protein [Gammaproteobacteria bacterium]
MSSAAMAGPDERAKRMHDRLAGVAGDEATLQLMSDDIAAGSELTAAFRAIDHPAFYSVTLKNLFTPATNRDFNVFADLNDYTATVIGMIRDDIAFDTVLSADVLYTGAAGLGLPAFSMTNNDHYREIEARGLDLRTALVRDTQTDRTDLPAAAVAGVMSTRAAAEAFFVAGTNRAMLRFTLVNHLCRDLEQLKDASRSPDRIRQDVTRSPGGDSRIFMNNCVACHTGMDPLAQAFAYYDFDTTAGRIVYTAGQVQPKYFINAENFPFGFVTENNRWDNYWREGRNANLGWSDTLPGSGTGAASMGAELAASDAFAQCQAGKVFESVCLRPPSNDADRSQVAAMVDSLKTGGFRMKQAFAEAAVYCMGD